MNRTHGVSIAATSEIISEKLIEVVYKKSNEMRADILTKGFNSRHTWDRVLEMIQTGERESYLAEEERMSAEMSENGILTKLD